MEGFKCKIDDRDFDSGAMVCDDKLCFKCEDGGWEKKGALALDGDAMSKL